MIAPWFFERLRQWGDDKALVFRDAETTYAEVFRLTERWDKEFVKIIPANQQVDQAIATE